MHKTGLSKQELDELYQKSEVFVNLSKYEGFGIPLVEAAQANCKIICSNLDVFHEVLGEYKHHVYRGDLEDVMEYLQENYPVVIRDDRFSYRTMQQKLLNDFL